MAFSLQFSYDSDKIKICLFLKFDALSDEIVFFLKSDFGGVGGLFVPGLGVKRLSGLLKFAPREPRRHKIDKNEQNDFLDNFLTILIKNAEKI